MPLGEKGKGDGGHYKYRKLALDYPQWVKYLDSDTAPDANEVYRKALAGAPDKSVVICSIGFLTNLRRLIETQPDDISPLSGRELVEKKVIKWTRGVGRDGRAGGGSRRGVVFQRPSRHVQDDR